MPSHGISFLAGAVTSAALIYVYQSVARRVVSSPASSESTKQQVRKKSDTLMDSSELDQRMIRKAEGAILNRTSRLIVVVERCTNDHNYSAILRTVEALGVQHVYIIAPQCIQSTLSIDDMGEEEKDVKDVQLKRSTGALVKKASESEKKDRVMHHLYARKATEWITITDFDDTKSCIDKLRTDGYKIWATDLGQVAVCLDEEGLPKTTGGKLIPNKLAIVFGTEAVGCSTEMLNAADLRVYLPLRGFADSLNLSVATALVVHQLFVLDPTLVGGMSEDERRALRQAWFSKLASQRMLCAKDKKRRNKLVAYLRQCDEIAKLKLAGEKLEPQQIVKLSKQTEKQKELDEIDNKLLVDSQLAVKDLVDNPPSPITDMRRADGKLLC